LEILRLSTFTTSVQHCIGNFIQFNKRRKEGERRKGKGRGRDVKGKEGKRRKVMTLNRHLDPGEGKERKTSTCKLKKKRRNCLFAYDIVLCN
jgi:hypothetical protein